MLFILIICCYIWKSVVIIFVMSTFKGQFEEEEFQDIAIDEFTGSNLRAKAFFLSHCHTDHMKGLEDPEFHNLFYREDENVRLYCSEISKKFLLKKDAIKIPGNKIIALNEYGNNIKLPEKTFIKVTYLPAGHCPGSVMFLFEGFGKTILYTGDFRLTMKDLRKMKPLHMPGGEVVQLDALYFDSTFADPNWETFPSREESLKNIESVIKPWLKKDDGNKVIVDQPACIGMEYLMMELSTLNDPPKIHVCNKIYNEFLSALDDKLDIATTDCKESRIHFCYRYCRQLCFAHTFDSSKLLIVSPRALSFTDEHQKSKGILYYESSTKVNLAYSSHPSFQETREFISYLKPAKIYPCVVPKSKSVPEFRSDILLHIGDSNDIGIDSSPKKKHCDREVNSEEILKDLLACSPKKARIENYPTLPGFESPPR